MSTPGLAQIWALDLATGGAPPALNFDIWVVKNILVNRVGANVLAIQLNAIPLSETRLRDEGVIPLYRFVRNLVNSLRSSARERGVTVPNIPEIPEDWSKEASTDTKELTSQFHPHTAGSAGVTKHHWASEVAVNSVSIDLFTQMVPALGGVMGGSEWGAFVAQMTSDELKGIGRVISEELLRIRAQPGSGWDEEEAKRLAKEQLGNLKRVLTAGA